MRYKKTNADEERPFDDRVRAANAVRHAAARMVEHEEQKRKRQVEDAVRHAVGRTNEDAEQRRQRLQTEAASPASAPLNRKSCRQDNIHEMADALESWSSSAEGIKQKATGRNWLFGEALQKALSQQC